MIALSAHLRTLTRPEPWSSGGYCKSSTECQGSPQAGFTICAMLLSALGCATVSFGEWADATQGMQCEYAKDRNAPSAYLANPTLVLFSAATKPYHFRNQEHQSREGSYSTWNGVERVVTVPIIESSSSSTASTWCNGLFLGKARHLNGGYWSAAQFLKNWRQVIWVIHSMLKMRY